MMTALAIGYILPQFLYPVAVEKTSLVVANVISNLYPGVTIFLASIISGQKISKTQNIGFVFAIIGVILVSYGIII